MRKPIPKSVRKQVYAKYNGHCAYCGCEIPEKGFNVDHLHCLRNYEYTEIDVHDIKNLMPSCGSCNRYKSTMDLEDFRKELQKIPDRLKRDVCTYNIALRYGMVQENREPIQFYFEKVGEEDAQSSQKIRKDIRQIGRISEKTFSSGQITNVNFVELKIMLSVKMAQKLS